MTNQIEMRLYAALRYVAGTCSDSTSLGDALRRVADALVKPIDPNHTYCKHCDRWRPESACRADPYINAEPRTYCPVAK
jgi:hypothetical protein